MDKLNERKELVKAMDLIVSTINDEDIVESWLMYGVPNGDIYFGTPAEEVDDFYCDDKNFGELMTLFLKLMNRAQRDGLYHKGVLSGYKEIKYCEPKIYESLAKED
jgi:hypothetical protein